MKKRFKEAHVSAEAAGPVKQIAFDPAKTVEKADLCTIATVLLRRFEKTKNKDAYVKSPQLNSLAYATTHRRLTDEEARFAIKTLKKGRV